MTALLCALLLAAPLRELASRAEAQLEAWDVAGATQALDELVRSHPDSPEAAYFKGRILFEQGKYDEAVKAYAEAEENGAGKGALESDIGLARAAAEETKGDPVFESAHFVLRTRPGKDTLLAPYALDALEKAYAGLTKDLGVQPAHKIRVEIYESAKALAHVSPLTVEQIKNSGTIALCKYSRLMVTSPKALLRGYPWLDTVSHEFVHYLVTQKGRNAVPIWLQEGLAKFLETRWRGTPGMAVDEMSLALLQDAAKKGKLIPFAKMHPSIAMLPTQEQAALAFAEVEAAIRLLYQHGGQAALTELVSAMASGMSDEEAVAQAYGKSFSQFEADWRAEVARPRAKAVSQKNVRPAVAKKLVFKEDAKGRTEPGEIAAGHGAELDADGKRAARLGEIFYARRRWTAAVREYGRARQRASQEVPLVARRYAFSQMQLGHLAEAEEALGNAVLRDPEDEASQALYAHVLLKRGALDKARAALDSGIAVDPFDPDLHATYVEVAKGLKDEALEAREKKALLLAAGMAPQPEKERHE